MVENKIMFAFLIIFLAFSFFFALAQEGSEENVSYSELNNYEIVTQETNEIVDFQIITSFEKVKVKRVESFSYFVTIRNTGTKNLERVKVYLILPEGITSEETEKFCESLEVGKECNLSFLLKTSLSTNLGKKEIKVRVVYG